MIDWRAALLVPLLAAGSPARAQSPGAADVPSALRPAVTAYRAGDLAGAEAGLRPLAPGNPEAEAWLGAVLIDRGQGRDGLRAIQHAADAGTDHGPGFSMVSGGTSGRGCQQSANYPSRPVPSKLQIEHPNSSRKLWHRWVLSLKRPDI